MIVINYGLLLDIAKNSLGCVYNKIRYFLHINKIIIKSYKTYTSVASKNVRVSCTTCKKILSSIQSFNFESSAQRLQQLSVFKYMSAIRDFFQIRNHLIFCNVPVQEQIMQNFHYKKMIRWKFLPMTSTRVVLIVSSIALESFKLTPFSFRRYKILDKMDFVWQVINAKMFIIPRQSATYKNITDKNEGFFDMHSCHIWSKDNHYNIVS